MDGSARDAAFGGAPDAPVAALAVFAATGSPTDRWLAAVALGGQGRYAHAAAVLRELVAGPDPLVAALAGAALAAHLRQLGGHAAARVLDGAALGRLAALGRPGPGDPVDPDGVDLAGAWSDAVLGLAADAVGLGRVDEARRLHAFARAVAGSGDPGWRVTVRTGWVGAEIELAAGRPDAAVPLAEAAAERAEAAGSVRHRVKSALVLGAALTGSGASDGRRRAEGLLTRAVADSLGRGIFPLAWPCGLLLAELAPERADEHRSITADALTLVFSRADGPMCRIGRSSPWVPSGLIRSGEPTRTGGGLTT